MTTDEFAKQYKLLKQITHGKGRSFTAQECATGRAVLVHFLTEDGQAPSTPVATLIDRLGPRDKSKILEILAVDRSTVVVTQFLEDFEGFDAWLQSRLAGPPAPTPESPSAPQGGEFTKLFEPATASPTVPPPPAVAPPAGAAPEEGPRGSFTELFRAPPESKAKPYPTPTPAPVEILSVRIPLNEPAPPRPVVPLPAWPSSLERPQAPAPPNPVVPAPRLRARPGEPIVKPPARDLLPPPSPVPGWSGESDYTRQLSPAQAPVDPPAPVAAPDPATASSAEASRSIVPLLLVLNIVVVIATGLILYFALKRR